MLDESTQPPTIGNITQLTEVPKVDNVLVRDDADHQPPRADSRPLYDATAHNKFPYSVINDGLEYDVAHVFGELTDERYIQWNKDLKVRGNADKVEQEAREASCKLWDDIIVAVEGVEFEGDAWKDYVPYHEKVQAIGDLLAVSIKAEDRKADGILKLGPKPTTNTITTEAFFNGEVLEQKHVMLPRSLEFEKKYEAIMAKRVRQQKVGGLSKKKPIAEYVPQDEKLGDLYDEMCFSTGGFQPPMGTVPGTSTGVPLRFKVAVINYIFAPTLDARTVGK